MSEFINNREDKQQKLKELIKKLHDGATVEQVQEEFRKLTVDVTATEITLMEQALVDEGMPVSDIQRLCDVHASVFKGSIEDIHNDDGGVQEDFAEGHPVHTFKLENRAIEVLLDKEIPESLATYSKDKTADSKKSLVETIDRLATIDKHYKRKENLLFPYMERYDITAPPQVMWGVDDEIRGEIKAVLDLLGSKSTDKENDAVQELITRVREMIFKEEEIMFPMILDKFTNDEWIEIEKSSAEIGYTLITDVKRWEHSTDAKQISPKANDTVAQATSGSIDIVGKDSLNKILFDAGSLTSQEVNSILNTIPLDMTFVGADNRVKYFTQGKERVFDRPITIIGREVKHCHPPKSVHVVEQIVEDLRSGKKDNEDFWIKMGGMFVYIRYFAVRSKSGEFLGTLEVTQNIKPIIELEGEKRLMS